MVVNGLSSGTGLNISSTSTAATGNTQKLLNIALSGTNSTSAQTTYGAYISNTHAGTTSTNVGLYVTASGGTTANYGLIVGAGNVGIGTITPFLSLDAQSTRVTGTATSVLSGDIDPTASTTVEGTGGTLFTTELVVGDRITVSGETRTVVSITDADTLTVDTAFTDNANDTTPDKLAAIFVARDSSNAVKFVINDLGWVGIGTSSPGTVPLEVKGTGTGATIAKFTDVNTTGCTIADGGTIACSSDETLKKNIEGITYGLETVMALHPVLYNWKHESDSTTKSLGFIAQEVEILIPKLVSTDVAGIKSLNTTAMVPILTRAVQEVNLNVEGLAIKVAEHDARISALEAKVAELQALLGVFVPTPTPDSPDDSVGTPTTDEGVGAEPEIIPEPVPEPEPTPEVTP
jgi:hypothetical protein